MTGSFDQLKDNNYQGDFELMPIYIQDLLAKRRFSVNSKPPNMEWLLTKKNYDGKKVGVGSRGEIVIVYGPPKTRKSTLLNCITASGFSSDQNNTLDFELDLLADDEILYVDTEMPLTAFHRRQMKLNKMCGYEGVRDIENFEAYSLKPYDYRERIEQIDFFVRKKKKLAVIFIDQFADLVGNINDRDQVSYLINKLSYWSDISQALIIGSIHATRGTENMTGVLGSELSKKMDSGFYLEKMKATKNTKVVHLLSREEDVEDFEFCHNEWGYPEYVLPDDGF
jgi:hypothetical protein